MKYSKNMEYPISAGGVVCRIKEGLPELVICGRNEAGTWSLPKGTPEFDETIEETAIREVREETGLNVGIQDYIGSIKYQFSNAQRNIIFYKTVYFYLMKVISGTTLNHDEEFDTVEWVLLKDALEKLTYENEVAIVQKANITMAQK